ncbi:hypothetical protein FACS1894216_02390 [Synergistales bacterium]|nr:hypothetical protein FACS1894216_02390 [Synergistales bacterium]
MSETKTCRTCKHSVVQTAWEDGVVDYVCVNPESRRCTEWVRLKDKACEEWEGDTP